MLPTRRNPTAASIWADPFDLLHRDFDRMLSRYIGDDTSLATASYPMDIWEDDDHLYVAAELPGFTRDQVNVTLENGMLSIIAERQPEEVKPTHHLKERRYARVQRTISLPIAVDENKVDAKLDTGVLTLTLNKREEVKPRKIEVK
ncbi:MAG: Hsp20/alpha crystallin family protein [Phycisphaeraceae bacterium]